MHLFFRVLAPGLWAVLVHPYSFSEQGRCSNSPRTFSVLTWNSSRVGPHKYLPSSHPLFFFSQISSPFFSPCSTFEREERGVLYHYRPPFSPAVPSITISSSFLLVFLLVLSNLHPCPKSFPLPDLLSLSLSRPSRSNSSILLLLLLLSLPPSTRSAYLSSSGFI